MIRSRSLSVLGLSAVLALGVGCESGKSLQFAPPVDGSARAPDRLQPGELAPGTVEVWGFRAPRQMRLERRFPDAAHFVGPVPAEALANYVRERVEAERVEVGAARTVFPKVHIKGGKADRIYQFDIVKDGTSSKLVLQDVTPPPLEPGLSEAERWRRAGMTPDGKQADPQKAQ
jgi:hypothetical protein